MRVRITIPEIDMATAEAFRSEVDRASTGSNEDVILDFAAVTYIDSSGLTTVVKVSAALESSGRRLVVVNAVPNVARVFSITGLEGFLGDDR